MRKRITPEELEVFLRKHKLWIANSPDGERANLRGADLRRANLYGANLRGADLRRANLYGADLYGANLRGADLRGADLRGANLYRADLRGADLRGADLYGTDLRGADLRGADLRGANLYRADLRRANLKCPIACPEEGSFTAFKKVRGDYIVKLNIPADARRCSATSRKCRCDKAIVISITDLDGNETNITEVVSNYDKIFIYRIGETVTVDNFENDRWKECAPGIHFFITRQEAVDY